MGMTWLLAVGVVLLVIVVGLSLLQRRAAAPPPRRPTPGELPPSGTPTPDRVRGELRVDDPDLGVLGYDNDRLWQGDSLDFDGTPILVQLPGDRSGPSATARPVVIAATAQARELWARGRDVVTAELRRRGNPDDDVEPYELAVDTTDGKVIGYLWYSVDTFAGEIGVSSRDGWRTLALEVIE
jgi:hypothetical protein